MDGNRPATRMPPVARAFMPRGFFLERHRAATCRKGLRAPAARQWPRNRLPPLKKVLAFRALKM